MKNTDNTTVIPEGEHSVLGPSSSKRWINCPGSVSASKDAKDGESRYAAEGTAAHYLSELARRENLPCDHWLGHVFIVGEFKFTVDAEMADSAQAFVDWCQEQSGVPLIEQRIDYSTYMPPEVIAEYGPTFGTLDDARLRDGIVYITDFKHGKGVQEWAERNTQLMLQALGVWHAFEWMYDIKGFVLQISQPRLGHFDSWPMSLEYLLTWAKESLPEHAQAVLLGLEFKAGDWCKFCRIRKKCAVRMNAGMQLMLEQGEFEDLDNLEVHAMRGLNRAQFVTNEQLAKILPAIDIFEKWCKDMRSRAVSALIAGESLGGWKLVAGRAGKRTFIDSGVAATKLRSLEVEPYKPPVLISVADAEKALGKKEFGRRFKLGEDFRKPEGKPKLAPPEDKRPAIDTKSVVEFDDLDAEDDE